MFTLRHIHYWASGLHCLAVSDGERLHIYIINSARDGDILLLFIVITWWPLLRDGYYWWHIIVCYTHDFHTLHLIRPLSATIITTRKLMVTLLLRSLVAGNTLAKANRDNTLFTDVTLSLWVWRISAVAGRRMANNTPLRHVVHHLRRMATLSLLLFSFILLLLTIITLRQLHHHCCRRYWALKDLRQHCSLRHYIPLLSLFTPLLRSFILPTFTQYAVVRHYRFQKVAAMKHCSMPRLFHHYAMLTPIRHCFTKIIL